MKNPNVFSREDVLRANEAMRRQSQDTGAQLRTLRQGQPTVSSRLSGEEINRAYAETRKALAA